MRRGDPMQRAGARGFTLIEMIMVMVITGVIAGIVAVFIAKPVEGYVDSVKRAELTDAADTALRRLARDLRLALPNSLRVDTTTSASSNYIEFIMTRAGGRYRDAADGSSGGNALDYTNTANTALDVLGPLPSPLASGASGDYIVVLNLGPGYAPADAYAGDNRAQIASVAGSTITLAANPFAAQAPPLPSPNSRFQVVPFATQAVKFICPKTTPGNLMRYWGYGFADTLATTPATGSSALFVANATCTVSYAQNAQQRNGIITINLTLTDPTNQESASLFHQIHVDNSP